MGLYNAIHSGLNYSNNLIPDKYHGMILLILIEKDNINNKTYRVFKTEQEAIDEYELNKEYFDGQMFILNYNKYVASGIIKNAKKNKN